MTSGTDEFVITKAIDSDIEEIKQIADDHKNELGFVRRPTLLKSIHRSEVLAVKKKRVILGFVEYRHRRDDQTTLYNIAVIPEYRRVGLGRRLVQALIKEAKAYDKRQILLKCPEDLAANQFYEALDFKLHKIEPGKHRKLKVWRFFL